jgi:transcriptional regulator with XRE-family HTH domain
LEILAEAVGFTDDPELLRHEGYVLGDYDILRENLRYLAGSLGHGGKKGLAAGLAVDPTTISRWLSGSFDPQNSTLRQLVSYFGLPLETDLRTDPLFLSAQPVSIIDRKIWLHAKIDNLGPKELTDLYPALRKLLADE